MAKCVSLTTAAEGTGGLFDLASMERRDSTGDDVSRLLPRHGIGDHSPTDLRP